MRKKLLKALDGKTEGDDVRHCLLSERCQVTQCRQS